MVLMSATKIGVGVLFFSNRGSHCAGLGYDGAVLSTRPKGSRVDLGGELGDWAEEALMVPLLLTPDWLSSFEGEVGDESLTSISTMLSSFGFSSMLFLPFLSFFSNGPFRIFHKAPQFATGTSDTLFDCRLVTELERGGRAGGGRRGKLGGVRTVKPESLRTIMG